MCGPGQPGTTKAVTGPAAWPRCEARSAGAVLPATPAAAATDELDQDRGQRLPGRQPASVAVVPPTATTRWSWSTLIDVPPGTAQPLPDAGGLAQDVEPVPDVATDESEHRPVALAEGVLPLTTRPPTTPGGLGMRMPSWSHTPRGT